MKAFQYHHYLDNDAKTMVKHLIFLRKFAVIMIESKSGKTSVLDTFCVVISKIMVLEYFQKTNCFLGHLVYTYLSLG